MTGLLWAAGFLLAGGASAILLSRWGVVAERLYATLVVVGCIGGAVPAIRVLMGSASEAASFPGSLPGGPWTFALDPLSAWFVLVILGVGAAAAVFGVGYLAPERGHSNVAGAHLLFAVLLTGLVGVVTSQAVVPFLTSWEVMALSAYLLIIHESERAAVRRAGLVYIVLTHVSTLALIGMFAALAVHATEPTFAAMRTTRVTTAEGSLALALGLVGFGVKAGVVPMHFWLPGAHAAAPSHVSALLSGVMLKTGIYGLLRLITILGAPPVWFGWALLGLGLVSGILGVVWALSQADLKRLLAYHSVENVGIILIGLGVGALGLSYHLPVVATLGFVGAILHSLNHAVFKSLLFLGAGVLLRATGTRLIDQLGGLGRRLPLVALAFGVGSIAIVGLPPLNGFVSEWLVFGGLFTAGGSAEPIRFAVFGVAGLGLIGGLALACFAKIDGIMFLGQARVPVTGVFAARRPGIGMVTPMLLLAAVCFVIGVWPSLVLAPVWRVAAEVMQAGDGVRLTAEPWIGSATHLSVLSLWLILAALAIAAFRRLTRRTGAARLADTWACAGQPLTSRMQYSASSFATPLLTAFGPVVGARSIGGSAGHAQPSDPIQEGVALPAWRRLRTLSRRLREWQGARVRWYLLSIVATLLLLLYQLARWKGGP